MSDELHGDPQLLAQAASVYKQLDNKTSDAACCTDRVNRYRAHFQQLEWHWQSSEAAVALVIAASVTAANSSCSCAALQVSEPLLEHVHDCFHLVDFMGSDHCPVGLVLKV